MTESFNQAKECFKKLSESGENGKVFLTQSIKLSQNIAMLNLAMTFLPKINKALFISMGSNKASHLIKENDSNLKFDVDGKNNANNLISNYLMLKEGEYLEFDLSGISKLLKQLNTSQEISEKIEYSIKNKFPRNFNN